jgi:hypothetical protein
MSSADHRRRRIASVFYVCAVLGMLAVYYLDPAPERREFYRSSVAAWRTWLGSS